MFDIAGLVGKLVENEVRFIVIGGIAAVFHGAARATFDLDIVYERSPKNYENLTIALADLHPYLRGAPPNLPFFWDEKTISNGLNFTLVTDLGALDLFGEILGDGDYENLINNTVEREIFNCLVLFLNLPTLIRVKKAAGRPKDYEAIAELESILGKK